MRKTAKSVSMAVVLTAGSMSATAFAEGRGYPGTLCNPENPSDLNSTQHGQYGVDNTSSTQASIVLCGASMAPTVNQKVSSMQFDAYDRNPNSGQDVCCAIIVQNMGGDALATMTLCTAGSKAGLYTPAANLPSPVFGQIANYRCSIPPQTTTGLSFLTSYVVAY